MKFAVLFPGQGSQSVGMGKDLYENSDIGKELFEKVDFLLNRKLSNIIFNGPDTELNQTINTQIAISTVSAALLTILNTEIKKMNLGFTPHACAGHSLGEYTALWYSKVFNLETLVQLVSKRGELMQNSPPGGMAAILNTPYEKLEDLLSEKYKNEIIIANYNNPNQFVISGNKELFKSIPDDIKSLGGKAIILPVSGAFHSPLMEVPSHEFKKEIEKVETSQLISNAVIPIYQNTDGNPAQDKTIILEKLKKQMTSPVYWTQTITNLVKDGVKAVIEIGPGKILTGLTKKINSEIIVYNIFDYSSLKDFIQNNESGLLSKTTSKAS